MSRPTVLGEVTDGVAPFVLNDNGGASGAFGSNVTAWSTPAGTMTAPVNSAAFAVAGLLSVRN